MIFIQNTGLIIIFLNIFGGNMAILMTNIFWSDVDSKDPNFGMKPECWVLFISVLTLPFIVMKELAEMKLVSVSLFCAAMLFVFVNIVQIIARGTSHSNFDTDKASYLTPVWGSNGNNFIQSISIIFTACNFQTNLFPIHTH